MMVRYIIKGIENAIKHRKLDLRFDWEEKGLFIYDYEIFHNKPFSNKEPEKLCELVMKQGIPSHEGIIIGFRIHGNKILCHDCTVNLYPKSPEPYRSPTKEDILCLRQTIAKYAEDNPEEWNQVQAVCLTEDDNAEFFEDDTDLRKL